MTQPTPLLHGRRIMVLDDEKYTLRMLRTVLQGLGATDVMDVSNAEEAARILNGNRFKIDCLCADFNMPKVHGLLLVKAIRLGARGLPRDLPIVMLTGHTNEAIVESAKALHVNGLIRKPVSRAQLETTLGRVFSNPFQAATPETYRDVNVKISLTEPTQAEAAARMAQEMNVNLDASTATVSTDGPIPKAAPPSQPTPATPMIERSLPAEKVDVGTIVARASELIEGVTFASGISINPRHVALIQHLLTTGPVGDIYVRLPDAGAGTPL